MKSFKELKKEINNLTGDILLIGDLDLTNFPLTNKNKFADIYYLNENDNTFEDEDIEAKNIASNIQLKELHKYFKDGIDNIYCNYNEIKSHMPSFFRESLRITKKKIYLILKNKNDFKKIEKKYKRYNLECNLYSFDECNLVIIESNDIIVNPLKEFYYYTLDNIEKAYNYISDNL